MTERRTLRPTGRGWWRALAVAVLLAAAPLAAPLPAQESGEAEPLSKADVIRLLTADTYTDDEVEGIVRKSCISFRLTDGDRADFRELGASPSVLEALEACSARRSQLSVTVFPEDTVFGVAGDSVSVIVTARRGEERAGGVPLTLRGIAGAPTATTDDEGVVRLSFVADGEVGSRTLEVASPDEQVSGPATIPLVVRPGPPAAVRIWPPLLTLEAQESDAGEVRAVVTDRFGNRVPGAPVVARDSMDGSDEIVARDVTDEDGEAVLRVPPPPEDERTALGVWAGEERLGTFSVRREARETPAVAPEEEGGDSAAAARDAEEVAAAQEPAPEDTSAAAAGEAPEEADEPAETEEEGAEAPAAEPASGAARSVSALRRSAAESPGEFSAWMELGRAWREAGRPLEARSALLRARELVSGATRDSVDEALARVHGLPPGVRASALGGGTLDREAAAGLRFVEARVRATSSVELWGRYDRSMGIRRPALLRGPDLLDGYYGGVEVEAGAPFRSVTLIEAGRREYRDEGLVQNLLRVEQGVRVPTDLGFVRVRGGVVVGRWYDRDDWLTYARAAIPVALWADLKPSVWVGQTVGTDLEGVGRVPAREVRGVLGVELRPVPGVRIEPSVGYGSVDSEVPDAAGSLWETGLTVSIPVSSDVGVELVARHQSPPGGDGFTVLAGGLRLGPPLFGHP